MNKKINKILEITNEFLKIPATTGFEFPFLNYLNKKIKKLGYETILKKTYLVVTNKNPNNLFSSHIDRQGLVLNKNKKIEYSAFYNKKKIGEKFSRELNDENEKNLIEKLNKTFQTQKIAKYFGVSNSLNINQKRFKIIGDLLRIKDENDNWYNFQITGNSIFFEKVALRYIRENISSYNIKTGKILNNFKTTRYDLNLEKNEITFEVDNKLNKEDNVFMLNSQINFGKNIFSAQIDNVISSAILFYLLKNTKFKDEIIFTTGEEYGNSWNCVVDYINEFKKEKLKLIILDTSPYSNLKKYEKGFITLRYGDERSGFDKKLVEQIKFYLIKKKIPYDFKPFFIGKTELGKIAIKTNSKINGTTIQLPTTNYHTSFETSTYKSLENYLKIIKKVSSN